MAPAHDTDPMTLAATLQAELLRRGAMLATAESLTGGRLGDVLSAAPGSSDTYLGGVVSYATEVKQKVLGVSPETVERHGVVSAECAAEMARGVRDLIGAEFAVSTTGVAGPTRQEDKPVGLVFLAWPDPTACGPSGSTSTASVPRSGSRPCPPPWRWSSRRCPRPRSVPGARVTDRRLPDEKFPSGGSVEVDHGSRRW